MKKINIAYITREDPLNESYWSGTSLNIHKCIKKSGFQIIRIGPIKSIYEKILKIIEKIYRLFKIKYDPQRSILLSKILAKKILKEITNKKIDLILVHDGPLVSFLDTEIPIIIWTDLTYDLYQKTYFSDFYKVHPNSIKNGNYLESIILKKAKLVLYSTSYAALNAIKKYKISQNKIKILPFGTDLKTLSKKNFNLVRKKRIISKKKETIFLSIGVDWNRKNMHKSIQVVKKLNLQKIKSKIIIVGSNPPTKYKIPKYVKIIPFLNRKNNKDKKILHNLFCKSHYFILLSKAEAFGLVINEASCYGLPIIASDIDGLKYVANKEYSILADKNLSISKIAYKIFLLNKDLNKYYSYSHNSYISSLTKNWNNTAVELKKIICQII
jgi:glycosyltransferase involved in cell wall biosynthesis